MSEVQECIRVGEVVIPLDQVSGHLRVRYEAAQREVATKNGVARNMAKAALNDVAREILAAHVPHLALKASPRSYGSRGFFEALARRTA